MLCFMVLEEDQCVSLRVKTPLREVYYFPVNTSVQDRAVNLYNVLKFEPGKGVAIWYEEELKNLDKRPVAEKDNEVSKHQGRKGRRRRGRQDL